MIDFLFQALLFMLPAYVANMVPAFFAHAKLGKVLDGPVDLGRKFRGKRVFGDHKTVKGFLTGTLAAIFVAWIQYSILQDYSAYLAISLGFLLGFGALVGDSVKSFFKRRVGIQPGAPFPPFDQLDFVAGSLLFASILIDFEWEFVVVVAGASFILHFLANVIGYLLKVKKVWW
jgi:CDP-2,3-bis-(O-geranylgeranyl)-sn-glycerol synthase